MGVNIFAKLGLNTDEFKKGISSAKKDASGLNGTFKQIGEGFKSGIGIGAGMSIAGMVQGAVTAVKDLAVESAKLAMEAQGVATAYDRFADPKMMDKLTEATKGTVSQLELMKAAVQAKNFGIPLEQMGSLLAFAHQRAKDTGQSVDYLVQSIIMGIGRKSPLILDNLGISAVALKEKMKGISSETATVGDVAKAVGAIASEAMAGIGASTKTPKEGIAELSATWENFKTNIGSGVVNSTIFNRLTDELTGFLKRLDSDALTGLEKFAVALDPIMGIFTGFAPTREAERQMQMLESFKKRINNVFSQGERGNFIPSSSVFTQMQKDFEKAGFNNKGMQAAWEYWVKNWKYQLSKRNQDASTELEAANVGFIAGLEENVKNTGEQIKNALTLKEAIGISLKFKSAKQQLEDAMYQVNQAGAGILEGLTNQISYFKKKVESATTIDAAIKFSIRQKVAENKQQNIKDEISRNLIPTDMKEIKYLPPIGIDTDGLLKNSTEGIKQFGLGLKTEFNNTFIDISKTIEAGIENLVSSIAEGIGEMAGALAMGEDIDAGAFGKKILNSLASFAQQFGELLIAQGIALEVFQTSMNPYTMIAAGVALVAVGAAIKKMTSKSSLSANASSPSSSGSSSYSNSSSSSNSDNRVIFEISKDSLSGVMQRDRTLKSRLV